MSDAPTVRLISLLVRCRPEKMVNAIRPWEQENKAHLTNFVSSPHFASARFYMIRWYVGKRPHRIGVERLRVHTNNIPGVRVVVPE